MAVSMIERGGYRQSSPRFRCPSCGKKGLGVIQTVIVRGRGVSFRICRYCGDQHNVPEKESSK